MKETLQPEELPVCGFMGAAERREPAESTPLQQPGTGANRETNSKCFTTGVTLKMSLAPA